MIKEVGRLDEKTGGKRMRMYDLIEKKRNGEILSKEEISYMVDGYVEGTIPDYQMSAMLMAIYFKGMNDEEIGIMTDRVAHSGDMVDLSAIDGVKVDKHSTGGVGDKTTLIIAPIVAACGVKVAKMSGRGLGHTGGTVDKLEAIPGMQTSLDRERFFEIVNRIGLSVIGQSGNMAPADKKLYALRDVTATVDSIPLIAVSIMSKKLAAGSDCILLDVKTGSGAFMKEVEDAITLAEKMVAIGEHAGKKTIALITDMDVPLGYNIGNSLEIIEAVDTLNGQGPDDLTEICYELASNMLYLAGKGDLQECRGLVKEAIASKTALNCLIDMVEAQGGDSSVIRDTQQFVKAAYSQDVHSPRAGYVSHINTEGCGIASVMLGAGRETKDSQIDYAAGISLRKKVGDKVDEGDVLATLYASDQALFDQAKRRFLESYQIGSESVEKEPLVFARVEKNKINRF